MLTPDDSRLLAKKVQIAIYNKDFEMLDKIRSIKSSSEITKEIRNYDMKDKE